MPPRNRIQTGGLSLMDKAADRSTRVFANRQSPLWRVPLERIRPDPEQPRRLFREDEIEALAASIRERGLLSPICVTREEDGDHVIVFGERRWRACVKLGLAEIDCIVLEEPPTAEDRRTIALVENIQRAELDPLDLALACRELVEREGVAQERAAEMLGVSRVWLTRVLSVGGLPAALVARYREAGGGLELSALQEIAAAPPETMEALLDLALSGATVRALRAARKESGPTERGEIPAAETPSSLGRLLAGVSKWERTLTALAADPPVLTTEQRKALKAHRKRIDALLGSAKDA